MHTVNWKSWIWWLGAGPYVMLMRDFNSSPSLTTANYWFSYFVFRRNLQPFNGISDLFSHHFWCKDRIFHVYWGFRIEIFNFLVKLCPQNGKNVALVSIRIMSRSHAISHALRSLIYRIYTNTFVHIDFPTCAHSYILRYTEWNERNNNFFLIFHHFRIDHTFQKLLKIFRIWTE